MLNFFSGVRLLWSRRGIHGEVFNRNHFTWWSLPDCINTREENFNEKIVHQVFVFFNWFSYMSNVIFRAPDHNFYLDIFIAKYSFLKNEKKKISQVNNARFYSHSWMHSGLYVFILIKVIFLLADLVNPPLLVLFNTDILLPWEEEN